jgi:mRNA interferase MazF
MMENQSMIRNSIVLVSFPFDDFSSSKLRPALCLTNKIGKMEHVVVAFISSKIPEELIESDLIIRLNSNEWEGTGLK